MTVYSEKYIKGFTLIELMIVLAILAILSGIAFSSYQDSVNKGRRVDALIALTKAAAMQEQHYFQANTYTTDVNDLGGTAGTLLSKGDHYSISSSSTDATADFTLTATAASSTAQGDEDCYFFRLASTGAKTAHKKSDSGYATHQSNCLRE